MISSVFLLLLFGGLTVWTLHSAIQQSRAFDVATERAVEVAGTITKVDRAVESKRLQPTFSYRTIDGEYRTNRSKVVFSGNRREQATYVVGASMPVLYDPEVPNWVVPVSANLRQVKLVAWALPVGSALLALMGLLGVVVELARVGRVTRHLGSLTRTRWVERPRGGRRTRQGRVHQRRLAARRRRTLFFADG